jgi:alkylhydroperoxidase family enzyme
MREIDVDRVGVPRVVVRRHERGVVTQNVHPPEVRDLVELCRLRIAQLLESQFDLALRYAPAVRAGLTDEKIAALPRYLTSEHFTERERACLEFTEQFVIASSAISDEDVARVMTVLTPEEFIYLCKALSVMDQFARASSAFRLAAPSVVPPTMPDFQLAA